MTKVANDFDQSQRGKLNKYLTVFAHQQVNEDQKPRYVQ